MKKFDVENYMYAPVIYENIKGKGKRNLILEDGSVIPEKIIKQIDAYSFLDFVDDYYKDTYVENISCPHLICSGCATLPQLENLKYDKNIIEQLNNQGLVIYLYETCYYDIYPKKNISVMFTELSKSNQHYEAVRKSLVGFESINSDIDNLYCLEFESIEKFMFANNLRDVTVKTVDFNIKKIFQDKYKFKIDTEDICLVSMFKESFENCNGYQYNPNKKIKFDDIQYKFFCANSRYEGFRHLICAILHDKNSNISFRVSNKIFKSLQNHLWFDLDKWKSFDFFDTLDQGIKNIEKEQQKLLNDEDQNSISLDACAIPEDSYNKSFVCIVNECKFAQPTANISEKTLNAIKCFRPFILVAPPHTLKYIKQYGIKTFNDYWDESYDDEEHHETRLIKIIRLINDIDKKFKEDQLSDLLKEMLPILEHNYNIIAEIKKCAKNII